MTESCHSEVLLLQQPDLFTTDDLIDRIRKRCCRVQNMEVMPKETLVAIFRRLILPLPQRFYRTNRRGKLLSARRAKSGLESSRREETGVKDKTFSTTDRLKPPPDLSKWKDNHHLKTYKESNNQFYSNEKRKFDEEEEKRWRRRQETPDLSPGKKITLKRSSTVSEKPDFDNTGKKQRTTIKWP